MFVNSNVHSGYYKGIFFENYDELHLLFELQKIDYENITLHNVKRHKVNINGQSQSYFCSKTCIVAYSSIPIKSKRIVTFQQIEYLNTDDDIEKFNNYKSECINNGSLILIEDSFHKLFQQQHQFMKLLTEKRNFPAAPLDLNKKNDQKTLKDISYECMHELFEAIQHLKNSKTHRISEIKNFNRTAFVEELADCLHYLIEICIFANVDSSELLNEYLKKGTINFERINNGY